MIPERTVWTVQTCRNAQCRHEQRSCRDASESCCKSSWSSLGKGCLPSQEKLTHPSFCLAYFFCRYLFFHPPRWCPLSTLAGWGCTPGRGGSLPSCAWHHPGNTKISVSFSQSEGGKCQMNQSGRLLLLSFCSHLPQIFILGSSCHARTILLRAGSETR